MFGHVARNVHAPLGKAKATKAMEKRYGKPGFVLSLHKSGERRFCLNSLLRTV